LGEFRLIKGGIDAAQIINHNTNTYKVRYWYYDCGTNLKSEIELKKTSDSPFEIPEKILAIWGRSILVSGWTSVPNELLRNQSKLG
ncbi:hypothetical protein QP249_27445, partial [Klebsiella pneumoniae]